MPPSLADALALRIERLGRLRGGRSRPGRGGQLDDALLGEVAGSSRGLARRAPRGVRQHIVFPRATATCCATRSCARPSTTISSRGSGPSSGLRSARALEAQPGPPDNARAASIAHHYHAAGDPPAALAAAVRAGTSPIEVQADREGAALFERALELGPRTRRGDLAGLERGRAARARGDLPFYAEDFRGR